MNKFYVVLTLIVVGIFGGLFLLNQKDSLINGIYTTMPTPFLPDDPNSLKLISPSLLQDQQLVQGIQVEQNQQNQQSQQDLLQELQDQQDQQGQQNQQEQQVQQSAPTVGAAEEIKESYSALIKTSKGDIELTLFGKDAPRTVANFLNKSRSGYYNGLIFHRVEDWVIQGGDPKGNGTGGGQMQTEMVSIPFTTGSLGVARGSDIMVSNDSQFFITKSEASWLNNQYTNFGVVTNGMDVVNNMEIGDKILGIEIK